MKTKNENNVYSLTCKVTGKVIKTNPKQFNDSVARLGITDAVLRDNYISREGKNTLRSLGMTASQASEQYGIDMAVAVQIKNLAKEPVAATPTANIAVEVPASAILAETNESTPVDENQVVAGSSVNELVAA